MDEKCLEEKSTMGLNEDRQYQEAEKDETNGNEATTIESSLLYTINDYSKQPIAMSKQLVSSQLVANQRRSSNTAVTILLIMLVSLVVSALSVFLTCLFIKRNYEVRNKTTRLLIESGGDSASNTCNRTHSSSSSSSSSFKPHLSYFNPDRLVKFLNRYYFINSDNQEGSSSSTAPKPSPTSSVLKADHHRQKILNCYEIATSAAVKKDNLKPVTVLTTCSSSSTSSRPNSTTESPYTNNTTASESNSNSPNNSNTKYDTSLSSSDEMIHNRHHHENKKNTVVAATSLLINKSSVVVDDHRWLERYLI